MFHRSAFDARSFRPISWAPADESAVPEDELRPEYRGSGSTTPTRFARYSLSLPDGDDDLIRRVREKWEAIEAAKARDAAAPKVAVAAPNVAAVEADSANERSEALALASVAPVASEKIAKPVDFGRLASVPVSQDLTWAVLYQRQREEAAQVTAMAKARRQADEEALMLVLAEVI